MHALISALSHKILSHKSSIRRAFVAIIIFSGLLFPSGEGFGQTSPVLDCNFSWSNGYDIEGNNFAHYFKPCLSSMTVTLTPRHLNHQEFSFSFPNTFFLEGQTGIIEDEAPGIVKVNFSGDDDEEITLTFNYSPCTQYGADPANHSNLAFRCFAEGALPNYTGPEPNDLLIEDYVVFEAGDILQANSTPFTLAAGVQTDRTFQVVTGNPTLTEFRIVIVQEQDADNLGLYLGSNLIPADAASSSGGLLTYIINDAAVPGNLSDFLADGALTFTQKIRKNCTVAPSPSHTLIQLRSNCYDCPETVLDQANIDAVSAGNPTFSVTTSVGPTSSTTDDCPGTFLYDFLIHTSSDAKITSLDIPFNDVYFDIEEIQVGAIGLGSSSGDYYTLSNTEATTNQHIQISLQDIFDDKIGTSSAWQGLSRNLSATDNLYGPWLLGGADFHIILKLNYDCNALNDCDAPSYSLTAINNITPQRIFINYQTPCIAQANGASVSQFQNLAGINGEILESALSVGFNKSDLDLGGSDQNLPFSYSFAFDPEQDPFTLFSTGSGMTQVNFPCTGDITYKAVFTMLPSPDEDAPYDADAVDFDIEAGGTVNGEAMLNVYDDDKIIEIPFIPEENGQNDIDFVVQFDDGNCPFSGDAKGGRIRFHMEIVAMCSSCTECVRVIDCIDDPLFIHCGGDCTAPVGTHDAKVERTTYGYTEGDYPAGQLADRAALLTLAGNDEDLVAEEVHKAYPFDELTITSTQGNFSPGSDPITYLGFEIVYSKVNGENVLDLEHATAEIQLVDANSSVQTITLTAALEGWPVLLETDDDVTLRYYCPIGAEAWYSNQVAFFATKEARFSGKFRLLPGALPASSYQMDYRCQFIVKTSASEGQPTDFQTSCDSWGDQVTILVPELIKREHIYNTTSTQVDWNFPVLAPGSEEEVIQIPVGPIDNCSAHYVVGYHLNGAFGEGINDFELESRPFLSWGAASTITNVAQVNDLPGSTEVYSITGGELKYGVSPGDETHVLHAPLEMETGSYYQGLDFALSKPCPTASGALDINATVTKYAYAPEAFRITEDLYAAGTESPSLSSTSLCEGMIHMDPRSGIPDGSTYTVTMQPPSALQDLPNTWFSYEISAGTDGATVGALLEPLSGWFKPNPGENLYLVPEGFSFDQAITIDIPVHLGCDPWYYIKFHWGSFCDPGALDYANDEETTLAGLSQACGSCEITRSIWLGAPGAATDVSSNFAFEGDELVWTIAMTNPVTSSRILNSQLAVYVPSGLIYNSTTGMVNHQHPVTAAATEEYPLEPVSVELFQFQEFTEQSPCLIFNMNPDILGGDIVTYTLRFNLSSYVCDVLEFNLIQYQMHAMGFGFGACSPPPSLPSGYELFTINTNIGGVNGENIPDFLEFLQPGGGDCIDADEYVLAINQPCEIPLQTGAISFSLDENEPFSLYQVYYRIDEGELITVPLSSTDVYISGLAVGEYSLLIINQFNQVTPMTFVIEFLDPIPPDISAIPSDLCVGSTYSVSLTPFPGSLSVDNGTGIPVTGVLNLTSPAAGPHHLIYSTIDDSSCATSIDKNVLVHELPNVAFSIGSICSDDPIPLIITPSNASGTVYINPDIPSLYIDHYPQTSSAHPSHWEFDPAGIPVGTPSVTVQYKDENGCVDGSPTTITFNTSGCWTCILTTTQ